MDRSLITVETEIKSVSVNINAKVAVDLTPAGINHLKEWEDKHRLDVNAYLTEDVLNSGRLTCLLWQLFTIFGSNMSMGRPQSFENNKIHFI